MIERKDIDKLAELSRVEMSDSEKDGIVKDLGSILNYISEIQQVATGEISEEGRIGMVKNVMREDGNAYAEGSHTKEIVESAPKKEGNYIKVKKILS